MVRGWAVVHEAAFTGGCTTLVRLKTCIIGQQQRTEHDVCLLCMGCFIGWRSRHELSQVMFESLICVRVDASEVRGGSFGVVE